MSAKPNLNEVLIQVFYLIRIMLGRIKGKRFYPWLVVILLSGVAFLNYMDRQMLSTMRFAMSEDIIEVAESYTGPWGWGALMAAFMWIYGFSFFLDICFHC